MSKTKNKQQQNYWQTQTNTAFNNAQTVSPLQQAYEKRQTDFLNWDNGAKKNITDAPGMNDYIQLGQKALARQGEERYGTGALQLGGESGYADKMKVMKQQESAQQFGAGLEDALAARRAEAQGSVMPLASLDQSRKQGLLGFAGNQQQFYTQQANQPGFWQRLLFAGMNGASQVGAGAASAGAF